MATLMAMRAAYQRMTVRQVRTRMPTMARAEERGRDGQWRRGRGRGRGRGRREERGRGLAAKVVTVVQATITNRIGHGIFSRALQQLQKSPAVLLDSHGGGVLVGCRP